MIAELNLIEGENRGSNSIPFERITYPDGQVSVRIVREAIPDLAIPETVTIISRMNDYTSIFWILAATDALKNWGVSNVNLFITCFLAQRSDRRFDIGQSFDLKMICDIIKAQHYHHITLFHPHSDVLQALLDPSGIGRVIIRDPKQFIQLSLAAIEAQHNTQVILISPDAGAYKWVYKLGEKLNRIVITGNKSRDLVTGDISLSIHGNVAGQTCLICDDYSDGANSFIKLATELKSQGAAYVYLYVSHGGFFKGYDICKSTIDHIYTTNSIKDVVDNDYVTCLKLV